jgi:hypothetical protein
MCPLCYRMPERKFRPFRANLFCFFSLQLEMWIEAPAGVCRLMSRRVKTPLTLSAELEEEAMEKIEDFMTENRHWKIDVFRDESNMPELS